MGRNSAMTSWHPFAQLFLSRLREYYREPEVLFWVYGFPLLLAVGLGIAFWNRRPEPTRVDVQKGPDAEKLAERLSNAGMIVEVLEEEQCYRRRLTGRTMLYVVPLDNGGIRYVYDETQADSRSAYFQVDAVLLRDHVKGWQPEENREPEPGTRYIDFLLPGLLGWNLMSGGLWGVGYTLVDMRVRKLLKRYLATPMRRYHFLLAVLASRMTMTLPEMVSLLLVGYFGFGVPIRGNLLTIVLFVWIGAAAFASIGLLLAARAEKIETISGLINLVTLPMFLLCGTFFSSKRFPELVQPLIQSLPLTQLNNALREVMLEGASLADVAWRGAILAAWASGTFLLALRWFRWK
jgi:ABC-type multidrug transport system permease subunit